MTLKYPGTLYYSLQTHRHAVGIGIAWSIILWGAERAVAPPPEIKLQILRGGYIVLLYYNNITVRRHSAGWVKLIFGHNSSRHPAAWTLRYLRRVGTLGTTEDRPIPLCAPREKRKCELARIRGGRRPRQEDRSPAFCMCVCNRKAASGPAGRWALRSTQPAGRSVCVFHFCDGGTLHTNTNVH